MQTGLRMTASFALAALMTTAAGCAAPMERPEQQLARAETSIEFAEENGAPEFGATALERARRHLDTARGHAEEGDYAAALHSAEKAELDAELAAAQSHTGKSERALAEIRESIETLRREIARNEYS